MATMSATQQKVQKEAFKIFGMAWYVYAAVAGIALIAMFGDYLPSNTVGAFAILYTLGIALGWIGDRIPVWNTYIGGGSILAFLGSALLSLHRYNTRSNYRNCKNLHGYNRFLRFIYSSTYNRINIIS